MPKYKRQKDWEALMGASKMWNPKRRTMKRGTIAKKIVFNRRANGKYHIPEIKEDEVLLFSGDMAMRENVVGMCHSRIHPGYLSRNLMVKHQCLKKKCTNLEKRNPDYWEWHNAAKKQLAISGGRAKRDKFAKDLITADMEKGGDYQVRHIDTCVMGFFVKATKLGDGSIQNTKREISKALDASISFHLITPKKNEVAQIRTQSKPKTPLTIVPGIGRATELNFYRIGIFFVEDLVNKDPEILHLKWKLQKFGRSKRLPLSIIQKAICCAKRQT